MVQMDINDGSYGIVWLLGAYDFSMGEADQMVSLGICRATKQLAFFSAGTNVPLRSNLFIERGLCSEGTRCLYTNCPSNRTTWSSYRLGSQFGKGVRSPQGFEGLKELRRETHLDLIDQEDFGSWIEHVEDEAQGYCIELDHPLVRKVRA